MTKKKKVTPDQAMAVLQQEQNVRLQRVQQRVQAVLDEEGFEMQVTLFLVTPPGTVNGKVGFIPKRQQ